MNVIIGEVFTWEMNGQTILFDIDMMKAVIAATGMKADTRLTLEMVQDALRHNYQKRDPERIAQSDWRVPVIAVTIWAEERQREEALIVDGWHRMDKYVMDKPDEPLKCYWFDKHCTDALLAATEEMRREGAYDRRLPHRV